MNIKETMFDKRTVKINEILTNNKVKLKIVENNRKFVRLSNDVLISKSNKPEYKIFLLLLKPFLAEDRLKIFDEYYDVSTNILRKNEILSNLKKEIRYKSGKSGYDKSKGKGLTKYRKNNPNPTPWNKGKKTGTIPWNKGKTKHTDSRLADLSESRKGKGNPRYGISPTQEQREKQSISMRQTILNGNFTPNTNNSNTHWDSIYNGKKYRSSWEVMFKILNPNANYETLRIEYFDSNTNKKRVTIVDFIDHVNKIVTEVKPKNMLLNKNTLDKIKYIKLWCDDNGYVFQTFTESDVKKYIKDIDLNVIDDISTRKKLEKYL